MGEAARYGCGQCGFESDDLLIGVGMAAVEQLPASCPAHGGMTTLSRPWERASDVHVTEDERTLCKECGAKPVPLRGSAPWLCPVCAELDLREIPGAMILWD